MLLENWKKMRIQKLDNKKREISKSHVNPLN